MNIPMAYDVVPSSPSSSSNGVIVNQHAPRSSHAYGSVATIAHGGSGAIMSSPASVMVDGVIAYPHGSDSGLSAPLLRSELEQVWAAEMSAEGLGGLPIDWYRQTPQQAIWGFYGVINRIISALV